MPVLAYADTLTYTKVVSVTPTIDTAVYASGELVGGLITLERATRNGVHTGLISSIALSDLDSDAADIDVVIFDSNPTATTFTDNAAFDVADADLLKVICWVSVTDYILFSDNSVGLAQNVNCPFEILSGTTLYAALVSRGTPDYATVSDLTLRVGILQD